MIPHPSYLIADAYTEEKSGTDVTVGGGGVGVNTGKGTNVNVGHGNVGVHTSKGTNVNVGHGNVGVNTGKGKPGGTTVNVGKGGVGVHVKTPPKKKPVIVKVNPGPFHYNYAATDTQIHDDPTIALFFLEKDLKPGTKMTLDFTPSPSAAAAFISRQEAKSVPFASAELPQILNRFSIDPNSAKAESMKQTLSECEEPPMSGERKRCATSLESMVEFATTSLNTRNVVAVSTDVDNKISPKQQYTIESSGVKKLSGSDLVVCHAQDYAYAVFYCHSTHATKAYKVSMVGTDRARVEAAAVCHTDTAGWNPKHVAFRVLGVKPGTVPVCHFLPQDHVVWSKKMN